MRRSFLAALSFLGALCVVAGCTGGGSSPSDSGREQGPLGAPSRPRIDHFVVLMMENRSFDSMLGFLYEDGGNRNPQGDPYEGLTGTESNREADGTEVPVFKIPVAHPFEYFFPGADPGEGFHNTNDQLYGTATPSPGSSGPTNIGFVKNFCKAIQYDLREGASDPAPGGGGAHAVLDGVEPRDIMGMYTPQQLPVLSGLAREFAVCDQWYCSVPSETLPNRAFLHMATSQGQLSDSQDVYTARSIFQLMSSHGLSWKMYGNPGKVFYRTFCNDVARYPDSYFGNFSEFQAEAAAGTLPAYSYLEPQWGAKGNSQHPPYDVQKGEAYLQQVYDTVRTSKKWERTMLIILYDENGGCYDHVFPPTNATPPDEHRAVDGTRPVEGFRFDRFGPRVPAILVSPWIPRNTIFRVAPGSAPLDHTSVLATLEAYHQMPPLTRRDAAAPHFLDVMSLPEPRTDSPVLLAPSPAPSPTYCSPHPTSTCSPRCDP